MKKEILCLLSLFMLFVSFQSCQDSIDNSYKDYTDDEFAIISKRLNLPIEIFEYTPTFENNFFVNHIGNESIQSRRQSHKATLGRVLFYDKLLSINETISCASCHKQELAFSDDVALSEGFEGALTKRNSLSLGNTIGFENAYGSSNGARAQFSWDESNGDIASQSKAAINSPIEMGMEMKFLVERVQQDEAYQILFSKAFGDSNILEHRILESIEEFVNSIVSKESKFDQESMKVDGNHNEYFQGFSEAENLGKEIYNLNCSSCHSIDHQFTQVATANNGLDLVYTDKGLGDRLSDPALYGVFKVPFLRNIALSAPFMHDGRFKTLEEVIDHYSLGIQNHENLDFRLKQGDQARKLNFTSEEKRGLKAYLETLTDESLMVDERFSTPFK